MEMWGLNVWKILNVLAILTISTSAIRPAHQERSLTRMMSSSSRPNQRIHPFSSNGLSTYSQPEAPQLSDQWAWKRSSFGDSIPVDPSEFGINFGKRHAIDPSEFGVNFGKRDPSTVDLSDFATKFGKRASSEFDSATDFGDLGTRFGKRSFGPSRLPFKKRASFL